MTTNFTVYIHQSLARFKVINKKFIPIIKKYLIIGDKKNIKNIVIWLLKSSLTKKFMLKK